MYRFHFSFKVELIIFGLTTSVNRNTIVKHSKRKTLVFVHLESKGKIRDRPLVTEHTIVYTTHTYRSYVLVYELILEALNIHFEGEGKYWVHFARHTAQPCGFRPSWIVLFPFLLILLFVGGILVGS